MFSKVLSFVFHPRDALKMASLEAELHRDNLNFPQPVGPTYSELEALNENAVDRS